MSRRLLILLGAIVVIVSAIVVAIASSGHSTSATTDTSPVNLSTKVNMADGSARSSAIVRVGHARFEVLSASLVRLEYSPSDNFENSPTVNAVNRRMPVPKYRAHVSGGWLTISTSQATLRYKVGSGPFTPANTTVQYVEGRRDVTADPTWDWQCPFDQTCQAGAAVLRGGIDLNWGESGYDSSAGYAGPLISDRGSVTWTVLGAPAGSAAISVRYAGVPTSAAGSAPQTLDLVVNGKVQRSLTVVPTDAAHPWSNVTTTGVLNAGSNSVAVRCASGNRCHLDVDTISIGPAGAPAPATPDTDPLGGWIRGFDTFTYGSEPTCAPGTAGATCKNTFEPLHADGLLDGAGWRLMDDTDSDVWTDKGWVAPRPRHGDVEDGYLFTYGQNFTGALRTFAQLTGSAPLLPRNVFGVWYSDYTPYSAKGIENSVYEGFVANNVPLNTLSLDTDWKSPNDWDGWEWNGALFPSPTAFLKWARARGINVTLNIHSSISVSDPEVPTAQDIAGNTLTKVSCMTGICWAWNWSSEAQAESNFDLQQKLQKQGVGFFWLDWCCDPSTVNMPGLTPDAWIDHLYAQDMVNQGQRGFVLARIGSSNGDPLREYPAGPWSNHTSTVAFTGDAWGTWATLAQEVALTPDEATIGEPYVSDDIGSYLGPPPEGTQDPAELYDRWVQFGTFQPILRLHSNNESRLPWEYPQPERNITESFLRLRAALLPYTYTLAAQAHFDALPMAQPLYLQYPSQAAAYSNPGEYLYGSNVLVAPVTSPEAVAQDSVWLPPGRWVDYFTGATFTGPVTTTVSVPLNRMPVFVRAGGIIPEDPGATARHDTTNHLDIKVYPGSTGTFSLYADSGSGLGYTKGQYTETEISDSTSKGVCRVAIGPAQGRYRGEPDAVGYEVDLVDLTQPSQVTLNGHLLAQLAPGSGASGWYYEATSDTVVVTTPTLPVTGPITVIASGGSVVSRPEPTATS